jgi:hypothetical protein
MRTCTAGLLLLVTLLPAAANATPAGELVQRLGDPLFEAREAAAAALTRLGPDAVAELEAGLRHPDAEVRRRCAELLPAARRGDRDRRLDDFIDARSGAAAPPGWARFRTLAGDDRDARGLFADLCRDDPAAAALLEKEPRKLAGQLLQRCQRLHRPAGPGGPTPGEAAAVVVAMALEPPRDATGFYRLYSACRHPEVVALARGSPAARRLLGRALASLASEGGMLWQAADLALLLGLDELRRTTLEPAVERMARAVGPPDWRFVNAVHLAQRLGMDGLIESKLKPAVRAVAASAARPPVDVDRLVNAVSLVRTLGMADELDGVLRPAAVEAMRRAGSRPEELSRVYQARHLAIVLGLRDAFDRLVVPGGCRRVVELARRATDASGVQQAEYLARALGLEPAFDGVVRPAARRVILADLEQSDDLTRLVRSAHLARQLQLADLSEHTLQPLVRRHAAGLSGGSPDVGRLQQVYNAAEVLGVRDAIDEAVKPAFGRLCRSLGGREPDPATLTAALQLARSLRDPAAVPLALRAAFSRQVPSWERAAAVLFVGELGGKADLARLEGLLGDTADCGSGGFNWTTINAQLRDVALAALVFRSGQALADYGFPYFETFPGANPFQSASGFLGFAGETDRAAALKKWQAWSARKRG